MAINLSIKSVPEELVEEIRKNAKKNHRSMQGELMTLLEENFRKSRPLSSDKVILNLHQMDIKTASDSTLIIRNDRNKR